jgi:four helix bundle protein
MSTHKDLDVWKASIALVTEIYKATLQFPRSELFGLVSQMRRSAVSISSNIAEGAARKSDKEFLRFLYIALGSYSELETQLIISRNLNYLSNDNITGQLSAVGRMLINLIKYYKTRK